MVSSDYVIVTHTDMDGVGSAALYIYYQGFKPSKIYFIEPYLIQDLIPRLRKLSGVSKTVFMDLGLNSNVIDSVANMIETLISKGIAVEWYDHHVWEDDWIKKLKEKGAKIYLDRSTCATGVVAQYAPRQRKNIDEKFVGELVKGVCAGDLFRFDHWRGPWFLRLIRRHDENQWRLKVLYDIAQGILWNDSFTEKVIERFEEELRGYTRVHDNLVLMKHNGVKIAVALSIEGIENSFLAAHIMGRYGADVVALTSTDGKISLRSKNYNVRELAYVMGGGGHLKASGCKIKIPWKIRLKALLDKKIIVDYVSKKLIDAINSIGGLKQIG